MTQIISIRTPDGIVIAGDSLATSSSPITLEAAIDFRCSCGKESLIKKPIQSGVALPRSTFSFAQKIFPFLGSFGLGSAGTGLLCNKTTYFAIRELESRLIKKKRKWPLKEVANEIKKYFHLLVKKHFSEIKQAKDNWNAISFQIVGYEETSPKTIILYIGKKDHVDIHQGMGASFTGEQKISQAFFKLYEQNNEDKPRIDLFSAQDAADYIEFMICTTANYQRFSNTMPTVGGLIDIALLTPFEGFKWIKHKQI